MKMSKRRAFNRKEHIALNAVSGGCCEKCGTSLEPGWHADHIHPFAAGGLTDISNAQALCPRCNREKGNRMAPSLLRWQEEAIVKYKAHPRDDFLLVATPGAGKTRIACEIVLLERRRTDLTVIAVPTVPLCEQWADKLAEVGVKARPSWDGQKLPPDIEAATVTYQALGYGVLAEAIRIESNRRSVLAILDEIHHLGDELSWGRGARYAFEGAVARLGLSGTPFRSDNEAIPFVRYIDGRGQEDFSYGYDDGLSDGVVRYVYFPRQGGRAEWITPRGEHRDVDTSEELPEVELGQRLRALIDADGGWLGQTQIDADTRLRELRRDDFDAAGLIVADDNDHADQIARRLERVSAGPVVVIHQNVPDARREIERFRVGTAPWLVAVRMVSEGVDIPRLRVCVFAANRVTPLFFRQVVGRVVRVEPGHDDQSAYVFIPDDPRLRREAEEIRQQREHVIEQQLEDETRRDRNGDVEPSAFTVLGSSADTRGLIIPGEPTATPEEVVSAEHYRRQNPQTAQLALPAVILLLRAIRHGAAPPRPASRAEMVPEWRSDKQERKLQGTLANRVAYAHEVEIAYVQKAVNRAVGVRKVGECTSKQLQRRRELLVAALHDPGVLGL
jgi:superfamily II DNA or RNA helicase